MLDVNAHEIIHLLKSINNHLQAIRERLYREHHYDGFLAFGHPGERVLTKEVHRDHVPYSDNRGKG